MSDNNAPVAVVTGGGRGIGRAISIRLAAGGHDVAVNYRRDQDAAQATVADIEALGRRAIAYRASVDLWDEDEAMVDGIISDFGRVDVLVHNCGIASRGNSVADTDPAEMERVVRTHAFGPFYLSKLLVPHLRRQGQSFIVFISSMATVSYNGNGSPYNMGKAAAEALAYTLAKEEQRHGIRVNIVAPGLVATEMGDRLTKARTRGEHDHASDLDESSPFGHVCRPEDVAEVVAFFASPAAGYVSNQRVGVNGGGTLT
jgi:3-oxoacyl-[acyl-carrier protein] reductase